MKMEEKIYKQSNFVHNYFITFVLITCIIIIPVATKEYGVLGFIYFALIMVGLLFLGHKIPKGFSLKLNETGVSQMIWFKFFPMEDFLAYEDIGFFATKNNKIFIKETKTKIFNKSFYKILDKKDISEITKILREKGVSEKPFDSIKKKELWFG